MNEEHQSKARKPANWAVRSRTPRRKTAMQLVEQHVLNRNDPRFSEVDAAAFAAKNLYNAADYLVRQSFINRGIYLNYYDVHTQIKRCLTPGK
jgi:hypothetical protein